MDPRAAVDVVRAAAKRSTDQFRNGLGMIASENIVSPRVQEMLVTDLHGRYAEGLPGKRYYQGCLPFDEIESLGLELAHDVFGAQFANIQSTSGTDSNLAVLKALTKPGDAITAVSTADGGHISHANMGAVGMRGLDLHTYPWLVEDMQIDIDAAVKMIQEVKPKLALFGQSMILFPTPMKEVAEAAKAEGAHVMYDGAHVLGLIAGGQFQDPLREGADVMTGSSHKTFPGPQGGFVLSDSDDPKFQRKLNSGVFPGVCSNYHLHHMAGKVIALAEFQQYGKAYARDIVQNAQAFGAALASRGFDVLAEGRGYTQSHQIVTRHGETDSGAGADAAQLLEEAGIITNMNMLPGDTKPLRPSGLRLGVQELTRVGMGKNEMDEVAQFYARVLVKGEDPAKVKADVAAFRDDFQVVRYCFNEEGLGGYEWHDLLGVPVAATRLAIAGTPGCGKTTSAALLARQGRTVTTVDDVARAHAAILGHDDADDADIVDIEALADQALPADIVVEGHLSHQLDVDEIWVIRCDPDLLRTRMLARGYRPGKIEENWEAECMDLILQEAMAAGPRVVQRDGTRRSPEELLAEFDASAPGHDIEPVDWSDRL